MAGMSIKILIRDITRSSKVDKGNKKWTKIKKRKAMIKSTSRGDMGDKKIKGGNVRDKKT